MKTTSTIQTPYSPGETPVRVEYYDKDEFYFEIDNIEPVKADEEISQYIKDHFAECAEQVTENMEAEREDNRYPEFEHESND